MVYQGFVRLAMLYGSETWCLRRRTERAICESNVWCKTDGEVEDRGPKGDIRIEGNSGSDGKGEWSEMVWACAEG